MSAHMLQARMDGVGERTGTRTQDLLIKSQLLYRLSYALPYRDVAAGPPSGNAAIHREEALQGQP